MGNNLKEASKLTGAPSEVDIVDLVSKLGRHKKRIGLTISLVVSFAYIFSLWAPRIYEANALLQIEENGAVLAAVQQLSELLDDETSAGAEANIITSRTVVAEMIREMNLDVDVEPIRMPVVGRIVAAMFGSSGSKQKRNAYSDEDYSRFAWGDEWIDFERFDVPERSIGLPYVFTYMGRGEYEVETYNSIVLNGKVGELLSVEEHEILIKEISSPVGVKYRVVKRPLLDVVMAYQLKINVEKLSKDDGLLRVTLADEDRLKVVESLNSLIETYQINNISRQSEEVSRSIQFLESQLPSLLEKVEKSERRLNEEKIDVGSINISAEADALLRLVVDNETTIASLIAKKAELDLKYSDDHPEIRVWRQQVKEQKARQQELFERVRALPNTEREIVTLTRDLEISTDLYTQVLNKLQELRLAEASAIGNVRIIDPAEVTSKRPVAPNTKLILVSALIIGVFASLAVELIALVFSQRIVGVKDVENAGFPVLAVVPLSDNQPTVGLDSHEKGVKKKVTRPMHKQSPAPILAVCDPSDLAVESIRSLRAAMHFTMLERDTNLALISGPTPGVGKSFLSANLATVCAQAGQNVLLIDLDLRRGFLHDYFGVSPHRGLTEYLSVGSDLEVLQPMADLDSLKFIPRGVVIDNPSHLVSSKKLEELIRLSQERYDLVIVDTPPVLAVADAAIVAQYGGSNYLVVRSDENTHHELEASARRFVNSGAEIDGVVLNAVKARGNEYSYGYYGYKYD